MKRNNAILNKANPSIQLLMSLLDTIKLHGKLSMELIDLRKEIEKKSKEYNYLENFIDQIFTEKPSSSFTAKYNRKVLESQTPYFSELKIYLLNLKNLFVVKQLEQQKVNEKVMEIAKEAGNYFPDIYKKPLKSVNDIKIREISRILQELNGQF